MLHGQKAFNGIQTYTENNVLSYTIHWQKYKAYHQSNSHYRAPTNGLMIGSKNLYCNYSEL